MKTPLNSAFGAGYLWLLALTSGCAFAAHHVSDQSTLPSLKYNSNQPGIGNGYDISDTGPRTLNTLSLNEFTTLRHEAYPKHSVRVKKSKFCDGTVDAYTGYVDIEAHHIFFYFFESRGNPDTDDVVFWTNGGPGASSAMGLFFEMGPCLIKDANSTSYNPHAWNENANIFFVDQPVGTGFSYADHGEAVTSSEDAAVDIAAMLFIFFEQYPTFKGRPLHMTGESYAGQWIPFFSAAIFDANARLERDGYTPLNLVSAMIGNGLTDYYHWVTSIYDITCTPGALSPVQKISTCVRMKQALPRCESRVKKSCVDTFDLMDCQAAGAFCEEEIVFPFHDLDLNIHDMSKTCKNGWQDVCYPEAKLIEKYLSIPAIQESLGVDPAARGPFKMSSSTTNLPFWAIMDAARPPHAQDLVGALLERGVRVLAYAGDLDWVCNWVGVDRWTRALDWTGGEEFRKAELREWEVDGAVAGSVRTYGGFSFATVHRAGHLVPMDKPKESLALLQRWMAGKDL